MVTPWDIILVAVNMFLFWPQVWDTGLIQTDHSRMHLPQAGAVGTWHWKCRGKARQQFPETPALSYQVWTVFPPFSALLFSSQERPPPPTNFLVEQSFKRERNWVTILIFFFHPQFCFSYPSAFTRDFSNCSTIVPTFIKMEFKKKMKLNQRMPSGNKAGEKPAEATVKLFLISWNSIFISLNPAVSSMALETRFSIILSLTPGCHLLAYFFKLFYVSYTSFSLLLANPFQHPNTR